MDMPRVPPPVQEHDGLLATAQHPGQSLAGRRRKQGSAPLAAHVDDLALRRRPRGPAYQPEPGLGPRHALDRGCGAAFEQQPAAPAQPRRSRHPGVVSRFFFLLV